MSDTPSSRRPLYFLFKKAGFAATTALVSGGLGAVVGTLSVAGHDPLLPGAIKGGLVAATTGYLTTKGSFSTKDILIASLGGGVVGGIFNHLPLFEPLTQTVSVGSIFMGFGAGFWMRIEHTIYDFLNKAERAQQHSAQKKIPYTQKTP